MEKEEKARRNKQEWRELWVMRESGMGQEKVERKRNRREEREGKEEEDSEDVLRIGKKKER